MYEFQILPFWNNLKNFTRSLRPSDSLPPVSPPFWRHIAKSDFFIFANSISQDHISTFVDWHFLTGIAHSRQLSLRFQMNFEFSLGFATRTMSRFLHRISNNICDFATGEGNDRPRSSLVFATRSTFVFLASFLHTNFSLHSIASETLNQFRLSTQSNVEGFNCCRYTKLSDDCAFNAWQKTTTHGKTEDWRDVQLWNLVRDVELKNKSPVSWSCFPPGWCSGRTSAPYSQWPRKKLASWATIASPLHVHETKYTSGGRRGSAESYRHKFNF